MKKAGKRKRWLKILGILLLCFCVLLGILYYVVVYRFKDLARILVNTESKGQYSLSTDHIQLSLFKRQIILENATLTCNDTLNASSHYYVVIPKIYCSVHSIAAILFHQRITIDSFFIGSPSITVHGHHVRDVDRHVSFQVSNVLKTLNQTLQHLEVRSFRLQEGSFSYSNRHYPNVFACNHINFSISNFSQNNSATNRLLSSDDLDLSIRDQYWKLPDGQHEVGFRNLHFSGNRQLFEMDSCTLYTKPGETTGGIALTIDKLYFKASQLKDLYEKEELSIDTLYCHRPVLNLLPAANKSPDSAATLASSLNRLFKKVRFGYINVVDGQFALTHKGTLQSNYVTPKENLQLFNLMIQPGNANPISIDSALLNVDSVRFLTKDSMYQLSIDHFALNKDELIFRNAHYGPSSKNLKHRSLSFMTPLLHLRHVSIEDLMQKKLHGTVADLYRPEIVLNASAEKKSTRDTAVLSAQAAQFFQTLHGLGELINVDSFNIINGNLHFQSYNKQLTAELRAINGIILINSMLQSDSMIDIKHSLPDISVGSASIQSPQLNLRLQNYLFKGLVRRNYVDAFQVSLPGKGTINGKKLYWEIFDWDIYQKTREIQVQAMRIGDLDVDMQKGTAKNRDKPRKDLPVIRLGKLDLDRFAINLQGNNGDGLQVSSTNFCMDGIASRKQSFVWNEVSLYLIKAAFRNAKLNASIGKGEINSAFNNVLHPVSIETDNPSQHLRIDAPVIQFGFDLHAPDIDQLQLTHLDADRPQIDLLAKTSRASPGSRTAKNTPLHLRTDQVRIRDGQLHYERAGDSLHFSSHIDLRIDGLITGGSADELAAYDRSVISLTKLDYHAPAFDLQLPGTSVELTKGKLRRKGEEGVALATGVDWNWNDLSLHLKKGDSVAMAIDQLSGGWQQNDFKFETGNKRSWKNLLAHATISDGSARYENPRMKAGITRLRWDGAQQYFHGSDFFMKPKLTMEESFTQAQWQKDYISLSGKSIDVHGMHFHHQPGDSSLEIKKILLDQLDLTAARDKRLPFLHGIEKLMPTELLETVKYPFRIDTLALQQSTITVHEISPATQKKGVIPLEQLNAVVLNLQNQPGNADSLYVMASTKLLNNSIDQLIYAESYGDSLAAFRLHMHASPMTLPRFSSATTPLAAIKVTRGQSDTLYSDWMGNKYAAVGIMNFHYSDLYVQILDKHEPQRNKFLLSVENFLANGLVVKKKNDKSSVVFFERDREKFIFNYWVKTGMSGFMTSIGVKKNKKYLRKLKKNYEQYKLPPTAPSR